ncbi:uncharacterized protein LOC108671942 [Hyalella azteca]|uniref:Uncharacterized protein LOC108671942 n=1 Tax=Hyalella azteca TaxID=294128 RepID=A0A979FR00_HYAAZ|nr:uncharacterized protein LOC108671942 [Hyalella azteca]
MPRKEVIMQRKESPSYYSSCKPMDKKSALVVYCLQIIQRIILLDAFIVGSSLTLASSPFPRTILQYKSGSSFSSPSPQPPDGTQADSSPIFTRFAFEPEVSSTEQQSRAPVEIEMSFLEPPRALALAQHRGTPSNFPHPYEGEEGKYPLYPHVGTLGPYDNNWFPEDYRNSRRNIDRSSTGSPGVEIVSLGMPALVRVGDNINLTCDFRLLGEGQRIYTVNWWRDKDQFYTYNTEKHNNKSVYHFNGIKVDEWRSTERSVVLLNVSQATSGAYKCEVMTEAPAFKTAVMYKNMTVVVPPASISIYPQLPAPALYKPGETIQRFCTATDSSPRTDLQWHINDIPATSEEQTDYPDRVNDDGRISTRSSVELVAPVRFSAGRARVSCLASLNGQLLSNLSETLYADEMLPVPYNAYAVSQE